MRGADLRVEIAFELEAMEITVTELLALQWDVAETEPIIRENTAAAAFPAQFYIGPENILKRISHFYGVPVPITETWHIELFQHFSDSPHPGLPQLFDTELASALAPYRRFRHVAFYSNGFQLDWHRMSEAVKDVQPIFDQIKDSLVVYLASIDR